MSLKNLAHVCSHLQNTSRARLAKTSVPLTKLHLMVALALQKQGFISSVEIGGKTPPRPSKDTILPRNADILSYQQYRDILAVIRRSKPDVRFLEPWAWLPSAWKPPGGDALRRGQTVRSASSTGADGDGQIASEASLAEPTSDELALDSSTVLSESEYQSRPWMLHYAQQRPLKLDEILSDPSLILQHPSVSLLSYEAWSTHSNSLPHGNQTSTPEALADEPWRCYPDPSSYFHRPGIRARPDPWAQIPENPAERRLWLGLKYWRNEPVISKCSNVSTGTRRVTMTLKEIAKIVRGERAKSSKGVLVPGLRLVGECMFFRTDVGLLEARECLEQGRGGMALCRVS